MPSERRLALERLWVDFHWMIDGERKGTHFADEEDGITFATSAGLVLDLEMRDRKGIANGLLQIFNLHWHFVLVQV